MDKPNFGSNEGVWTYRDIDGSILGYVVRKKMKDGKKRYTPWTLQDGRWVARWYEHGDKPIYKLDELAEDTTRPVLVVEGEKTADAAQRMFPDFLCITWMGGASAIKKVDFELLLGRLDVVLWPDNDEPGIKAMGMLASKLQENGERVRIVSVGNLFPPKWDLADATEEDYLICRELINTAKSPETPFDPENFIDKTEKGRPVATKENLQELLKHYNITVRYNIMSRDYEFQIPNYKLLPDGAESQALTYITDMCVRAGMGIARISEFLDAIGRENAYHPVRDWILSRELTEPQLLDRFLDILPCDQTQYARMILRRWMLSAVAALFSDGYAAQGALVIQGAQGTHKTSFVKSLCPIHKGVGSGLFIDPSIKDTVLIASSFWIVELGELDATFKKADIARLKAYITSDVDEVRLPYERRKSALPRRSVFIATVNDQHILADDTGNRRWWTVPINAPIDTRHGMDMQQIWRHVYELWRGGEQPEPTEEERALIEKQNEQHRVENPLMYMLLDVFDFDELPERQYLTTTEILNRVGKISPTETDVKRMTKTLKELNLKRGEGVKRRHYLMPAIRL